MSLEESRGELSSRVAGAPDVYNGDHNANTVDIGSKQHMKLSARYTSVDGRVPDRRMGPEGSSTETLLTSPCNGAEDDLVLGAEAKSITAASGPHPPSIESTKIDNQDATMSVHALLDKRVKWQSLESKLRDSVQSDHSEKSMSSISSVDVLLQQRQMDPEAMLMDLGFGGNTSHHGSSSQIPPRFLVKPSEASGIEIDHFINNDADLQQIINAWKERNSSSGAWQHGFQSLLPSMRFITALQSSARSPTSSQDLPPGIQSVLHPDNQRWLALQGYYDNWPEDVLKAQLNSEIVSLVSAGKALRNQTTMDAKSKRNRFHATHSKVTMPMEKQINEDSGIIVDEDRWKRPMLKSFSNDSTDSCMELPCSTNYETMESIEFDHRLLSNGSEMEEHFIPMSDANLDATAINNLTLTIAKHLPDATGKLDSEKMSLLELPKRPGDQFSDSGSGSDHTVVDDILNAELEKSSLESKLQRGQHLSSGSEVPYSSADIPLIKTDVNGVLARNDSAQSDSSGFADTDNSGDMSNLEVDLLKVAQLGSSAESDSTTITVLHGRQLSQRHLSSISLPDGMDGEGLSPREMVDKCVSTSDLVWYPPLPFSYPGQQVSVYHMELSKDWKSVLLSKKQTLSRQASEEQNHVSMMELQLGNGGVLSSTANAFNESSKTPIRVKDPPSTSTPKDSENTAVDESRGGELMNSPIVSNWECVNYTMSGTKQHSGTVLDVNSNYKILNLPKSKEVFLKTNASSGNSSVHTVSTLKLNVVASDSKTHFVKADVFDKASSKDPCLLEKTSSNALRLLETDLDEVFEEKQFELKRHEARNVAKSIAEDLNSKMNYSQLKILINQPVCYKGSFNSQMLRPFKELSSLADVDSLRSIEHLKAETRLVQQSLQRYKTELCMLEAGFLDKQHDSDSQTEEESLAIEDLELLWSDVKEEILVMERLLSLRLKKLSRGQRMSGDSVSLLTLNVISQMVSLLKEQLFHRCMHHGIENARMLETSSHNAAQQEVCHLLQDIQHQTSLQPTIRSREMDSLLDEMRSSLMSGMRKELRTNSNWIQRQLQFKDSRIKQLEDELAVLQHFDHTSDFRSYSDDDPDGYRNYPEDDHSDRHRNFRSLQDELG